MKLLKNVNIEFINRRNKAYLISAIFILIGLVSLFLHGGPNWSIDFRGGILLQLRFHESVSVSEIREVLNKVGFGKARIQNFGDPREVLIQAEESAEGIGASEKIKEQLLQHFGDEAFEIRRSEHVGPKIGRELEVNAVWAILISLLVILVYIWIRFKKLEFGLGAIVALFHDVIITLGIFSLIDMEISLVIIAAFLTIVGYSLNDTIVVFDRIRENIRNLRKEPLDRIINTSINQTLNRTIITSSTTLLVVITLTLFGGEVIFGFSLALVIGVIVGTYSSIFIATPIVIEWNNWRELKISKSRKMEIRASVPQKRARYR